MRSTTSTKPPQAVSSALTGAPAPLEAGWAVQVLALQRLIGNRAVGSLFSTSQQLARYSPRHGRFHPPRGMSEAEWERRIGVARERLGLLRGRRFVIDVVARGWISHDDIATRYRELAALDGDVHGITQGTQIRLFAADPATGGVQEVPLGMSRQAFTELTGASVDPAPPEGSPGPTSWRRPGPRTARITLGSLDESAFEQIVRYYVRGRFGTNPYGSGPRPLVTPRPPGGPPGGGPGAPRPPTMAASRPPPAAPIEPVPPTPSGPRPTDVQRPANVPRPIEPVSPTPPRLRPTDIQRPANVPRSIEPMPPGAAGGPLETAGGLAGRALGILGAIGMVFQATDFARSQADPEHHFMTASGGILNIREIPVGTRVGGDCQTASGRCLRHGVVVQAADGTKYVQWDGEA